MKRKLLRLLALALCLALLAGCGAQGTAASTPESGLLPARSGTESAAVEPEEPEEPPYTGPLYEISVGDVRDKLPDFEEMSSAYLKGNASGIYFVAYANSGDFLGYETERYGHERYLTNSKLMNFPELDEYVFLGTLSGRTLFCNENGEGLFATDGDGNILYRAPENIKYLYPYDDYMVNEHGREGMLPFYDTETGYDGYLNLEDFSTWELGPEYAVSGYTRNGTPVRGGDIAEYDPFSEGMKAVLYAESTDTFFHIKGQNKEDFDSDWAEKDIAGFVDKNGEFVFKFCDLPEFDGLVVCTATDYYQGKSIVTCHARGLSTGASIRSVDLFEGTHYEIDTKGNILREYSKEENVARLREITEEKKQAGEVNVRRIMEPEQIPTGSIYLTDDLVLVGGKTLRDRNGTCYEIPKPDGRPVKAILVFANGLVLLGCKRDERSCDYYYLQYEDIRPEGFEAGTSDFWPNAMSIHDYDWPE